MSSSPVKSPSKTKSRFFKPRTVVAALPAKRALSLLHALVTLTPGTELATTRARRQSPWPPSFPQAPPTPNK